MTHAYLSGLFRPGAPGHPVVALRSAEIIAHLGMREDRHTRPGSLRQLLLVDAALLATWSLEPGNLGENMTITGLDLQTLARGQRLRIGSVELAITIACPPCAKLDTLRSGLRAALRDQRGIFAEALTSGTLHVGDVVALEHSVASPCEDQ